MAKQRAVKDLYRLMAQYGDQAGSQTQNSQQQSGSLPDKQPAPSEIAQAPDLAFGVTSEFSQTCPECGGLGYVRRDLPLSHPDFGKLEDCRTCRGPAKLERLRRMSRLSLALTKARLDDFDPRTHLGRVTTNIKAWMRATRPGWLTLTGPHGTGKTFLLACIVNTYIDTKTPALYTTVADLLGDLQASFNPNSEQVFSALFANVMAVDVLALDEAEKWHGTEWAQTQVFRLLEHRSRHPELRTVMATNSDLRPLHMMRPATLYGRSLYPGYIESRISEGMIISDFWSESDFRPIMAAARQSAQKREEQAATQLNLLEGEQDE